MKKFTWAIIFSGIFLAILMPALSQAGISDGLNIIRQNAPALSNNSEVRVLTNFKNWLFMMAFILFAVAAVASGVIMIVSAGNTELFNIAKKWLGFSIIGLIIIFLADKILATVQGLTGAGGIATWQIIGMVLLNILLWLMGILIVLSAIAFVASGIVLIVSGGSKNVADKARQWITYAITGLVVAFSTLTILFTIFKLFAISPLLSMIINFALGFLGLGAPFTVQGVLMGILRWLTGLLAVLAAVALVTSGIMLIISGGVQGMAERAKTWIAYSVLGLVVALVAYIIINTVSRTVMGF